MKLNVVPAPTGGQWVKLAVRTFFSHPLAITGLFFMFMAVLSLAALVPVVGTVVSLALVPALTVGMMEATREVDAGRFPRPATLFVALRQGRERTRAMLGLGGLYAAAAIAAMAVSALIDGGQLAALYQSQDEATTRALLQDPRLVLGMLSSMMLYLPISLAFWHAPALMHWHQVPALKSIFFSVVAVWRNARAFLVYGLFWLAISIGLSMVMVLLALLLGRNGAVTLAAIALPLSIVLAAMFYASLWFVFRDSFSTNEDKPLVPLKT